MVSTRRPVVHHLVILLRILLGIGILGVHVGVHVGKMITMVTMVRVLFNCTAVLALNCTSVLARVKHA